MVWVIAGVNMIPTIVTEAAAPLVAQVAARYPLVDLSVAEPSIEDVIARIYAGVAT